MAKRIIAGSESNLMIFFFFNIRHIHYNAPNSWNDMTFVTNDSVIMRYTRELHASKVVPLLFLVLVFGRAKTLFSWKTFEPLPDYGDILFQTEFHPFQVVVLECDYYLRVPMSKSDEIVRVFYCAWRLQWIHHPGF